MPNIRVKENEPIRDWTYDASQWRQLGFTGAEAEQDPGP